MPNWDVFICHASEDKKVFVEPLANRLRELAVRVWFDKFELVPGDRLSEKIGEGLAKCRAGVLVFSRAFLEKAWTKYEMSGLVNRFVEEKMRLFPIWLDVKRDEIANFNPALADLVSIHATHGDVDQTALEILRAIRPQLYQNLSMLSQISSAPAQFVRVHRSSLKIGPIRHHDFEETLLIRIQNLWFTIRKFKDSSPNEWINAFQRDLRPEIEVAIWERIISALNIAIGKFPEASVEISPQLFQILVKFSIGDQESVLNNVDQGRYDPRVAQAALDAWLNVVPPMSVSEVEEAGN